MRYDVKKFLIMGAQEDRERFFTKAQQLGLIHFIDINPQHSKEVPQDIQQMNAALKILRGLPTLDQQSLVDLSKGDEIAKKIIDFKNQIDRLHEKERILNLDIARVEVFGDFSLEDIAKIEREGHCKVQFFCAKQKVADELDIEGNLIYIASDHDLDYFMAINKSPIFHEKLFEMQIEHPLGELKKQLHDTKKEIHRVEHDLKEFQKYNAYLHQVLIHKFNRESLYMTQGFSQTLLEGSLFAVEGWVPVHQTNILRELVENVHVYYEEVEIEPTDVIPTYLENEGIARVGEDLVHIYDTPSYRDKDPSLWVLFAFSLFFGMIVGDAGYGFCFLAGALYIRYKFPNLGGIKKRMVTLGIILGISVLLVGIFLTNSFFGMSPSLDSPIRKVSLLDWLVEKNTAYLIEHRDAGYLKWIKQFPQLKNIKDPHAFLKEAVFTENGKQVHELFTSVSRNILFEMALMIGVIHISLGFLRYLDRNWAGAGWIIFMVGCYLYFPTYLGATSMIHFVFGISPKMGAEVGMQLIIGGVILAMVLAFIQHRLMGLLDMLHVMQIFGDVLSYLRIYALGLAGAILAEVVNDMVVGLPVIIAAVILILAHFTNMLLGIMGGTIHGLRLNFLEWYHYSFEGRGRMFKPLQLFETEK